MNHYFFYYAPIQKTVFSNRKPAPGGNSDLTREYEPTPEPTPTSRRGSFYDITTLSFKGSLF
jgi:hypothetical protein